MKLSSLFLKTLLSFELALGVFAWSPLAGSKEVYICRRRLTSALCRSSRDVPWEIKSCPPDQGNARARIAVQVSHGRVDVDTANAAARRLRDLTKGPHLDVEVCYEEALVENFIGVYRWVPAAGMFRLSGGTLHLPVALPSWLDPLPSEEKLLESRGWGWLSTDPNDSVEAPRGVYEPLWGDKWARGFDPVECFQRLDRSELLSAIQESLPDEISVEVSLRASTEPMGRKRLADRRKVVYGDKTFMTGCYRCAISKLPLFHGDSLTQDTVESGWLSFSRPYDTDYIVLRKDPLDGPSNPRTEVLCAATGTHLGHYFPAAGGRAGSYCINACVLTHFSEGKDLIQQEV